MFVTVLSLVNVSRMQPDQCFKTRDHLKMVHSRTVPDVCLVMEKCPYLVIYPLGFVLFCISVVPAIEG